jgi:N-acetylglutamate synthase-like GNAT family acetyltransferase
MRHALPPPALAGEGIVRAAPADLPYVVHLQKRYADALGFLPRAALAEKIELGQVWLSLENGEPAGFLHHGSLAVPEVRIFQAAVQYDARRRHLGLALVQSLADRAAATGARGISLRCLSFLEANDFWRAAGFTLLGTETGAKGTLNVWAQQIEASPTETGFVRGHMDRGVNFAFHSRLHACPACGRPTFDTWTRGAVRRRLCRDCLARGVAPRK